MSSDLPHKGTKTCVSAGNPSCCQYQERIDVLLMKTYLLLVPLFMPKTGFHGFISIR